MVLIGGSPETMWLLLQESPGFVSLQFSVVWTKQIGFSLVSFLPRFSVVSTKNHLFTVQIHVLRTKNTGNLGRFWIFPRFSVVSERKTNVPRFSVATLNRGTPVVKTSRRSCIITRACEENAGDWKDQPIRSGLLMM